MYGLKFLIMECEDLFIIPAPITVIIIIAIFLIENFVIADLR